MSEDIIIMEDSVMSTDQKDKSVPFANEDSNSGEPVVENGDSEQNDMEILDLTQETSVHLESDIIYLRKTLKLEKDYLAVLNHQTKLQRLTYTLASYIKQIKVNCPVRSSTYQQDLQSVKNQYNHKVADCKNVYNDCMKQVEVSYTVSKKYVEDRWETDRNPKNIIDEYYKNYLEYLKQSKQSTIQSIEYDYKVVQYHLKKLFNEKISTIEAMINPPSS